MSIEKYFRDIISKINTFFENERTKNSIVHTTDDTKHIRLQFKYAGPPQAITK